MPRGSRQTNAVFKAVLKAAAKQLHLASAEATAFDHSGIRGDERAAAFATFLRGHLPENIGVAKGEAIDHRGQKTGQLDIIIYDAEMAAPIASKGENVLVPAESLLAVIEVKTTLTQDEINSSYAAAKKVRALRPFKGRFVSPRADGRAAEDGQFRCMYLLFSYGTNLSALDWAGKEIARIENATSELKASLDLIDVVYVHSQGMLRPAKAIGKMQGQDGEEAFLDLYLHLVNFLCREIPRRPVMDWQAYVSRTARGWVPISATR